MATDGSAALRARARLRSTTYIAIASAALMISFTAASSAQVSSPRERAVPASPVQGLYEYCAPSASSDGCIGRLRQIRAGGFRVVLNYAAFDADRAQLQRYMQVAASLGLKLIWPMKDTPWWGPGSLHRAYPRLSASCGCSGNSEFIRYAVDLVKSSPATWGYYVADESSPGDATAVAAFSRTLQALDPAHPRLAVAVGDDSVANLLAPYAAAADVLGADSYPIGTGQSLSRVGMVGRAVKAVATRTHRRSAMVLQAFDWSSYPNAGDWPAPRWPTRDELRQMRDLALRTADPSLILWYSYFDIRSSAQASSHWRDLVWAAFGT